MLAAIDVQHHSRYGPAGPSPTMFASFGCLHESGELQCLFDPCVADVDPMIAGQLFMKMPHVEIGILFLEQPEYFLRLFQRNSFRARVFSSIIQTRISTLLDPTPPSSHRPVGYSQDLSRFPPAQLP